MTELFTRVDTDRGMGRGLWTRRAFVTLFAAIALLAVWGLFGQRQTESVARGGGATMTVSAPDTVRGGLYYQATVDVSTTVPIEHPRFVLREGWLEGMQVNSIEPSADTETSRDGLLVLSYGALAPGDRLKLWLQFQVDPTSPGRRPHGIELDDETRPLARVDRDLTVLP